MNRTARAWYKRNAYSAKLDRIVDHNEAPKVPGQKDMFAPVLPRVPGQFSRCPCGFGAYGQRVGINCLKFVEVGLFGCYFIVENTQSLPFSARCVRCKTIVALLLWCSSVCRSVYRMVVHTVHVSAYLSLWLDNPMFWAPWYQSMSVRTPSRHGPVPPETGAWMCKLSVISRTFEDRG